MKYEKALRIVTLVLMLVLVQVSLQQTSVSATPSPRAGIFEFAIPTSNSYPFSSVISSGNVYFTEEYGNKIGQLNPYTKTFLEWAVAPPGGPNLRDIAVYQGKLYFAEFTRNKIGRLDPSTNTLTEWTIPTSNSQPWSIAVSGGKVWFTEFGGKKVGRLDLATNSITEWTPPGGDPLPFDIIVDSSGRPWFTRGPYALYDLYGKISRLDPSTGTFKEWILPVGLDVNSGPDQIMISADNKMWFTERYADRIGRLDYLTDKLTEWNVPRPPSGSIDPNGLVEDAMGNIFFTEQMSNKVGKLKPKDGVTRTITPISTTTTPVRHTSYPTRKTVAPRSTTVTSTRQFVYSTETNYFTEWPIPTAASQPTSISTEDGTLFCITEIAGNKIALLFPGYTFTEWATPFPWPNGIAAYSTSSEVWLTELGGNRVARLSSTTNKLTQWLLPTVSSAPSGISVYNGKVYFAEKDINKIARLDPSTNMLREWSVPTPNAGPDEVIVSGGMVWFIENSIPKIGRLNPSTNTFTEWPIPDAQMLTGYIIAVYSGRIYFAANYATSTPGTKQNRIGRLDPSTNILTQWTVVTQTSYELGDITVAGGKIYYTEKSDNTVNRLDPSTNILTHWKIPTINSQPSGIGVYNGKVWFAEGSGNKIGKLFPTGGIVTQITPTSVTLPRVTRTTTLTAKTLTPTTTILVPTKNDVLGYAQGPITEWTIPTTSSIGRLRAPGGGNIWFIESNARKIATLG